MISSLRKKRRTIRRSILRWMQDNICLSTGMVCAIGLATFESPATAGAADKVVNPISAFAPISSIKPTAPPKVAATVKREKPVSLNRAAGKSRLASAKDRVSRGPTKVIRGQDNPFEEESISDSDVVGRSRVTQVSGEEPATDDSTFADPVAADPVATDPVASEPLAAERPGNRRAIPDSTAIPQDDDPSVESAALRRLKDRSAKERMEKVHEEWLMQRKARLDKGLQTPPTTPSKVSEGDPFAAEPADSADAPETGLPPNAANVELPGDVTAPGDRSVRAPKIDPGMLHLQSQPKPLTQVPTEEELSKLYAPDDERLAAPVRDPAKLPKISDIDPNTKTKNPTPGRQVPEEDPKRYVKLGHLPYVSRTSPESVYAWEATKFAHRPLYFEDPTLERYGHTLPPYLQPFTSIGKFGAQVVFLPYQMAIAPPCSDVSPLGWYAPGDYVPFRLFQPPLSAKGAAVEAATILGVGYATP